MKAKSADLAAHRRTVKQLTQERQAWASRAKQAEKALAIAEARFDRLLARDAAVLELRCPTCFSTDVKWGEHWSQCQHCSYMIPMLQPIASTVLAAEWKDR